VHVAGISFLPYPGAAYATQVLDGSAVTAQTLLPGVAYNAVVTTAVEAQSQYAHPVSSSYSQSVHLSTDKNMTAANTLPVLNAVNQTPNNGQSVQFRQPLQSINLTDLLDYSFLMEHGVAEAAGTVDLRNPAVLANMLQSLNAASLPSASCSYERNSQVPQPVDIRQFSASKQPVQSQQLFQEAVTVNQQHVPLSSHQTSAGQLYGTVVSSATVVQSSQQKGAVQGAGVMWPWGDQLLITDRAQNEGLVGVVQPTLVTTSVSSCSLPVSYEAVSPPAASVDNMSFSLLDNLQFTGDTAGGYQLNSFLGSTVDTSTLFAAAAPYSLASALQPSRTDTWSAASAAVTSASFSATAAARLQPSVELHERSTLNVPSLANRQPNVELEKVQKQKSNLGIVVPMTHSSRDERGSTILQASSSCNVTMSVPSSLQSVAEQQSHYLTNTQTSVDKSTGPGADAAAGGIVLTNITGNVYVNQYTMMPGGTQPVDNALLHADLSAGAAASSMPYDNAADETMYSLAAPSVAFMLNTNNELGNFASAPVTSVATVQQPRNPQPQSRKAVAPESSFFGADAAPVLAAKPSNKFESCFLQFICGHKSETLSSVLNSPIKTRPVLPKYVPEPRRPKPAELPVNDTEDMTETIDEPIPATAKDVIDAPAQTSAAETAIATSVCYLTFFLQGVSKKFTDMACYNFRTH